MNDSTFSLSYHYVDGKSEYYIDKHECKNRIFPFCVAVSVIEGEYFVDFEDGKTVCAKPGEIVFVQSFIKHTIRMKEKGKLTHAHFLCSYVTIDIFALAKQNHENGIKFPKLYIWCGTEDSLITSNRNFHNSLTEMGVEHLYEDSEGDHSWPYWDLHIQSALNHLLAE